MQTKSHTSYSTYLRAFLIRLTFNRALYYNIINVKIRRNFMYCRKCGKQIDYDSEFCVECKAEAAARAVYREILEKEYAAKSAQNTSAQVAPKQSPPAPAPQESNGKSGGRLYGFGKALASAILAFFAFCFMMTATETVDAGFFLFSLGFFIPALIMGISSMKGFFNRKREGYVTPIPSLVLGSIAVGLCSIAGFAFFVTITAL